jgi:hypothetical protein
MYMVSSASDRIIGTRVQTRSNELNLQMTKTTKKCIKLSFYTSLFLLLFSHATSDQLHDQEHAVLLKLKQHWQNPPPLSHWTSSNSSSHCIWPEITCSTDGSSVTRLSLKNMNIIGTVPPFMCDLKNLTTLDLSYNYMTSNEFPRLLYNCSKLQYLNLSQNFFAGTVPDRRHSPHGSASSAQPWSQQLLRKHPSIHREINKVEITSAFRVSV